MEQDKNQKIISIIPDEEIILDNDNDLLGTKVYSDILTKKVEVLKDSNIFYTIGLFGSWGSGKSSIIKTFCKNMEGKTEYKIMTYDAWKYSNDSFRRTFIIEMMEKLEIPSKEETKKKLLYNNIVEKTSYENMPNILIILTFFFLFIIILPIPLGVNVIDILGFVIAGLSFFFGAFLSRRVTQENISTPEQFDWEFNNIIKNITQKNDSTKKINLDSSHENKKIIIIIDNIDRCDPQTAKEMLSTVKNFFNHKKCIFIIPVDDKAIKKHISEDEKYGDEFLRKFFNTTIRIKDFCYDDFYPFTLKLIENYNLNYSEKKEKIADLVSKEFCKNPRRIIQFLNNLSTELSIIKELENKGKILPIYNNIGSLAKILIIREEWNDLYNKIVSNPSLVDIINSEIINKDNRNLEVNINHEKITLTIPQYNFLKNTLNITIKNIESFLRLQDYNNTFDAELIKNIVNPDFQFINNYIENEKITHKELVTIIIKKLKQTLNRGLDGYSILNLVFEIVYNYNEKFDIFFDKMKSFINKSISNLLTKFNINHLLHYSKLSSKRNDNCLRDLINNKINSFKNETLNDDSNEMLLLNGYIDTYKDDINALERLSKKYSDIIDSNDKLIEEFIDNISTNENIKYLITNDLIESTIKKLENVFLEDHNMNSEKIHFIKLLNTNKKINKKQKGLYVSKLISFYNDGNLDRINNKQNLNYLIDYVNHFSNFLECDYDYENFYRIISEVFKKIKANFPNTKYCTDIINISKEYIYSIKDKINNTPNNKQNFVGLIGYLLSFYKKNIPDQLIKNVSLVLIDVFEICINNNLSNNIPNYFIQINNGIHENSHNNSLNSIISLFRSTIKSLDTKNSNINVKNIKKWLDNIFHKYDSDICSRHMEELIISLLEFNITSSIINEYIKQKELLDLDNKKKYLKIISKTNNSDLLKLIVVDILNTSNENNGLIENINYIDKIISDFSIIKEYLTKLLQNITIEKIDDYKKTLDICIRKLDLLSNNEVNDVISKMIPLINDNQKNYDFSLSQLKKIEDFSLVDKNIIKQIIHSLEEKKDTDTKRKILKKLELYL